MRVATPVNLVITNEKNQILLIRRSEEEDEFKGYWSIPGGGPENKETFEETLKREIKEEIGCEITSAKFFKSYYFTVNPGLGVRAIYFLGTVKGAIVLNDEFTEYNWFSPEEIKNPELKIAFNQREVLFDFLRLVEVSDE